MRIIGGEFKGRRFEPPRNITARPTTDFAKEGLFNTLSNRLDFTETTCLDLFSGTGFISLELASRGCPFICSVEKNDKHLFFLKKVMKELNLKNIQTIKADVFKFLASTTETFNFIFADPPYELPELKNIPSLVFEKKILKKDGLLVVEHPKKIDFSSHPFFIEHRHYGNVNFSFFKTKEDGEK